MYSDLDLTYYSGKDGYSDGDVEQEILNLIEGNVNIDNVLSKDDRWPVLYHLSPIRRNLLEWYDFDRNKTILEIGAGCGALTGLFCERLSSVTAVELSKMRAEIISARNRAFDNLRIMVGNFQDIDFESRYDYITLIGALEYSGMFIDNADPYTCLLKKTCEILAEDGTLIIAIENKFGLKYWAGSMEDHTRTMFSGITGYNGVSDVRTFGKPEIMDMLKNAGFGSIEFYYPMPDYKMPTQIFSDKYDLFVNQMRGDFPNYDMPRINLFDTGSALKNIAGNGMFDFFANSFLVFAKKEIRHEGFIHKVQ